MSALARTCRASRLLIALLGADRGRRPCPNPRCTQARRTPPPRHRPARKSGAGEPDLAPARRSAATISEPSPPPCCGCWSAYGAAELDAAIREAIERGVPHPNAVRLALEHRRELRDKAPPVTVMLPEHVKVRDVHVQPHRLTANHSSCRRPWPITTRANRLSNRAVGTRHKSIAAIRLRMVSEEPPPALGGRMSASDHVRRDRGLGELEPQLEQFTMDAGSAPQRVLFAHSSDQIAQVAIYPRPPCPLSRFPAPVGTPPDATARSSPAQRPEPYRVGSATAGSSTPAARDRCPEAEDVPVVASTRY